MWNVRTKITVGDSQWFDHRIISAPCADSAKALAVKQLITENRHNIDAIGFGIARRFQVK